MLDLPPRTTLPYLWELTLFTMQEVTFIIPSPHPPLHHFFTTPTPPPLLHHTHLSITPSPHPPLHHSFTCSSRHWTPSLSPNHRQTYLTTGGWLDDFMLSDTKGSNDSEAADTPEDPLRMSWEPNPPEKPPEKLPRPPFDASLLAKVNSFAFLFISSRASFSCDCHHHNDNTSLTWVTNLSHGFIYLLLMRVHLCKCPNLSQIHILSIPQRNDLVKCKYDFKGIINYVLLVQRVAVVWNLAETTGHCGKELHPCGNLRLSKTDARSLSLPVCCWPSLW